ncbi:unnamed protein product [Caenorhabditis angaria]|uniref:Uncharacterized protein n=1 Tax=Caenorhabditis angaria TaxID=860376 RepID=A0A9P1ILH6_9PELO|nr:unnamed protein product [Caenorhabditis angaria]
MTRDFSEFLKKLKEAPTKWTVAKIICCLRSRYYVNIDLKKETFNELTFEKSEVFEEREKVEQVVKHFYNKCQLQIYGPLHDVINEIHKVTLCPGVHKDLTIEEYFETEQPRIIPSQNRDDYCFKHDMIFAINSIARQSKYTFLAEMFLKKWIASSLGKGFDLLNETYSFLPISVMEKMFKTFYKPITELPFIRPLKIKDFESFRGYFEANDLKGLRFFDKEFMEKINLMDKSTPIATNQHVFIASYVQILTICSRCKFVFDRILKPKLTCEMKNDCPVIRIFDMSSKMVMFALDVDEAVQIAIKKNHPEITYRTGLFPLEDHISRAENGVINGLDMEKFGKILQILNLRPVVDIDYVSIVAQPGVSIISPYGTLCQNSEDSFEFIIGTLVSIVQFFQTMYTDKVDHVAVYLEQFEPTFGKKKYPTFVETKKLGEIVHRVVNELRFCLSEESFNYCVPYKPSYTFPEVVDHLQRLIGDLEERKLVKIFAKMKKNEVIEIEGYFSIRSIHLLYQHFIKMRLGLESEIVTSFGHKQLAVRMEEDTGRLVSKVWNDSQDEVLSRPGPSNPTPYHQQLVGQQIRMIFVGKMLGREVHRQLKRPKIICDLKFEELKMRQRNLNDQNRKLVVKLNMMLMKIGRGENEPSCSGEPSE